MVNLVFYREFYPDLKKQNWTNVQLLSHYEHYGKNELRITSEEDFYDKYPNFNVYFYREFYSDLKVLNWNNIQLIVHYYNYGQNESRITSEEIFYNKYPDFNIEYYKKFNNNLNFNNDLDYFKHYHFTGFNENNNYLTFDFTNDKEIYDENFPFHDNIYNHHFYRKMTNYQELHNYNSQYKKKYYIHNFNSFFKYYTDFDYNYYKEKYPEITLNKSEIEILLDYHLSTNKRNISINKKKKIIIYTPPLQYKCGGIIVMHYFAQLINTKYNDKFYAKLFMHNNLKYKNEFCNDFANIDEINDDTIVIYPEIVTGNPLNAKNVVRWILLELGIEMPIDHYKTFGINDLVYRWETHEKQLACPYFNNIFYNKNLENRTKTCYLIKKGRLIHNNLNSSTYIHPSDSILIDDMSLTEISNIFNECKYFYSYDPNSAYVLFSAVCGCIPIIKEIDGIEEDEYFKSKIYYFNNTIYNKGIVYGNNTEKINYILENKLNENNEEYYRNLFLMYQEKSFPPFLEKILTLF